MFTLSQNNIENSGVWQNNETLYGPNNLLFDNKSSYCSLKPSSYDIHRGPFVIFKSTKPIYQITKVIVMSYSDYCNNNIRVMRIDISDSIEFPIRSPNGVKKLIC